MKVSELIEELQIKLRDFGDIEVKYGKFAELFEDAEFSEINDISVEELNQLAIILWDK